MLMLLMLMLLLLVLLSCSDLLVGGAGNRVNIFVEVDAVQGHVVIAEDVGLDAGHEDVLLVVRDCEVGHRLRRGRQAIKEFVIFNVPHF